MKKLSRSLALFLCVAIVITTVGCSTTTTTPPEPAEKPAPAETPEPAEKPAQEETPAVAEMTPPDKPEIIQICGATSGGTYFLLANAISQMLNTEASEWFKASPQSTAGTPVNIRLMEENETDFAFGQAGVAQQAMDGTGAFEKKYTNISSVTYVYPNVMQIAILKDSGITEFADFEGKTFAAGASGSATELNTRDMFQAVGLTYDDVTIEYTSETQSADLMKNRQADGANLIAALGAAAMTDLMSGKDVDIYSFSDEELDAILALNPAYFKLVIPAGTYPNQDYDVKTFAVANYIFCRRNLSDDLVYQFTKAIYDNTEALVNTHKIAANIKPESAVDGLTVPLHPGAEKFYKEIGAIE